MLKEALRFRFLLHHAKEPSLADIQLFVASRPDLQSWTIAGIPQHPFHSIVRLSECSTDRNYKKNDLKLLDDVKEIKEKVMHIK